MSRIATPIGSGNAKAELYDLDKVYGRERVNTALDKLAADIERQVRSGQIIAVPAAKPRRQEYAESGAEMDLLDDAVREQVSLAKADLPPRAEVTVELRHNWATFNDLARKTEVFCVAIHCGVPTFSVTVSDVNEIASSLRREYRRRMEAASEEHDAMCETDK